MSTTLKALEQLEPPRPRHPQPPLPHAPLLTHHCGHGITDAFHTFWKFKGYFGVAVAAACLILGFVLFMTPGRSGLRDGAMDTALLSGHTEKSPAFDPDEAAIQPRPTTGAAEIKIDDSVPDNRQSKIRAWYGDQLKLQAVVWGTDPQARQAMVNNRMVHQGEVVNGYTIAVINQHSVIISRDDRLWQLILGR